MAFVNAFRPSTKKSHWSIICWFVICFFMTSRSMGLSSATRICKGLKMEKFELTFLRLLSDSADRFCSSIASISFDFNILLLLEFPEY